VLSPFKLRRSIPLIAALALTALAVLAIFSAQAAQAQLGDRTLRMGDRGKDVRALQTLLRRAGFPGRVNGVYGRSTWLKVRTVERELGLSVNGVITARDVRRIALALKPSETSGGFSADQPRQRATVDGQEAAGAKAVLTADGLAVPPANAPQVVKDVIEAGNRIAHKPYRYGGGHGKWEDSGYDCSGSMSYAFHGAGMLDEALDSTGFMSWGEPGPGRRITVYANAGHAFMVVDGRRYDTSALSGGGTRWTSQPRSTAGFVARHPPGL
jgi:cell wall-associated NlpC family hydrolase